MPIHPRTPKDLLLAPVAAEIDLNLSYLRDLTPKAIDDHVILSENTDTSGADRDQRAAWILDEAVRGVELHDWHAEITGDAARLRLSGGSVSLDLGLSASILEYITHGA
jgi:hypothetical protein